MKDSIFLNICKIALSFFAFSLPISDARSANNDNLSNSQNREDYRNNLKISQNVRYVIRSLAPVVVRPYSEGCGSTFGGCRKNTDVKYVSAPASCEYYDQNVVAGRNFGRGDDFPSIETFQAGSVISDAEYQAMDQDQNFKASLSRSKNVNYSGGYSDSFASRSGRGASFSTNVLIFKVSASAQGRDGFWRGGGSQREFKVTIKVRCPVASR